MADGMCESRHEAVNKKLISYKANGNVSWFNDIES